MTREEQKEQRETKQRWDWTKKELNKLWKEYKKRFPRDTKKEFDYFIFNNIPWF